MKTRRKDNESERERERKRRRRSIDDKISINERSNSAYLSRENAVDAPLSSALERGGDFFPSHGAGWCTKEGTWIEGNAAIKYF